MLSLAATPLLSLAVGNALPSVAASTVAGSFPYEQMVMAKLPFLSAKDAKVYLSCHSTRYYLKLAGMTEDEYKTATAVIAAAADAAGVGSWYDAGIRLTTAFPPTKPAFASEAAAAAARELAWQSDPMFLQDDGAPSGFPIDEATLVRLAKKFLFNGQGVEKPDMIADDFCFMGPFVGGKEGLPKAEYCKAVGGFDILAAFPDLNPRFHHFRADPLDPGRIWFTSQASGTDSGAGFLGKKPTGKSFSTPPQACSVKFNEDGLVVKYTIGHVMERSMGNTGGLGGVFGPAYALGSPLPFPEANPWKPSKRYRALMLVGNLLGRLKKD